MESGKSGVATVGSPVAISRAGSSNPLVDVGVKHSIN